MATIDSLTSQLRSAGLQAGDSVVVHASMKAIGPVDGGAATLVDALLAAVGSVGTLMIPTFADPQPNGIFDVQQTPSRLGYLSETFRTHPRARRSWHPTHAVSAVGPHLDWLVDHHKVGGLSKDSPLHRAASAGALVMLIGCSFTSCSMVHVAESIMRVPYLGRVCYPGYDRVLQVSTPGGETIAVDPIDPPTCSAGFGVVEKQMLTRGLIRRGDVGSASAMVFSAKDAIAVAAELLGADPAALLCHSPRCIVCEAARTVLRDPTAH